MRSALIIAATFASVMRLSGSDTAEIAIGLLLPPEEAEAGSLRAGAMLGVEQANQSAGRPIKLIVRGRSGQWGADGEEAARMVADDGACALITPTDGAASHLVLQVSGRTAVPVVSLCADSSVSETGIPWMVRIVPRASEEVKALLAGIPSSHWVAAVPEGRAGREISRDLRAAATAGGRSLERFVNVHSTSTNVTQSARQILAYRPDTVLLWLDPSAAGRLAKVLRAGGFSGRLAGPGRLDSVDFLTAAGDGGEGTVVPVPAVDEQAVNRRDRFAAAYRTRFGHEPAQVATMSHDAVLFLSHLLRRDAGLTVHSPISFDSSLVGASGILDFDSRGNRKVKLRLIEVRGARFVPVSLESRDR